MTFDIRLGVTPQDRTRVAHLFWQAFEPKLAPVFGTRAKGVLFIAPNLNSNAAFCAFDGQELVGVVGFRTAEAGFLQGGFRQMRAVFGLTGGLWRSALLEVYGQPVGPQEVLIDGVFVDTPWQGRRIGTRLLHALSDHAIGLGKTDLVLDVVAENTRAVALYQREGFAIAYTKKLGLRRWLFKATAVHRMTKTL